MTKDGRRAMKCVECDGAGVTGRRHFNEESMYGEAEDCPYCKDGLIWSDDVKRKFDRLRDADCQSHIDETRIEDLQRVVAAFRAHAIPPIGQGKDSCLICYGIGLTGTDGTACECVRMGNSG